MTDRPSRRWSWPLVLGGALVVAVAFVALTGRQLAPHDPMRSVFILRDDTGEWVRPPFPAGRVPGYPLGSDVRGRDLLSQLLWAVGPTMAMVVTVASLRLLLGTAIGLAAGWSVGLGGRALDAAISSALGAPVIIVGLGVIALVGIESGVLAFVVGLSLTGWAETARLVREQTRGIKGQMYIESARALGSSDIRIVVSHVLRQVTPFLRMLLALEVSSTLLATATLGFLGYYLGGGVWFQVGDFEMVRIAGIPELGQMLAIAAETPHRPEAMAFSGTIVFVTVLGFNLLGEGLRRRLAHTRPSPAFERVRGWLSSQILSPLTKWALGHARILRRAAFVIVLLAAGGALVDGILNRNSMASQATQFAVPVRGNHLWASERRDPQGTLTTDAEGPRVGEILWTVEMAEGVTGGPAVDTDGAWYVVGTGGLYSHAADGSRRWHSRLGTRPVGGPALGADGTIYVTGEDGSLSAFDSGGSPTWDVPGSSGNVGLAGPIVGPDGILYYPVDGYLRAVSSDGELLWSAQIPFSYASPSPRLDPQGQRVIFDDLLFDSGTGSPLSDPTFSPVDRYVVGANGRMYLQGDTSVTEWRPEGEPAVPAVEWDLSGFAFGFASDSGVTHDGFVWLAFQSEFQDTRIVWADLQGNVLGTVILPIRSSRIVGVDRRNTLYFCGAGERRSLQCVAHPLGSDDPLWRTAPGEGQDVPVGGALIAGRMYVATAGGRVYTIGQ